MAFVYYAYGYAGGRVATAGLTTAVYATTWFGLLFVPAFTGSVEAVTVAGLAATAVQLGTAFAIASYRRPRPWPTPRPGRASRLALLGVASVLGAVIVTRSGLLLDPLFGSLLSEGAVSELSFAARIAVLAMFVAGQGASYSILIVGGRRGVAGAESDLRIGIVASLMLATAAAATLAVAGPDLAELIFARGELTSESAREVGELLRLWAPAVIVTILVSPFEMLLYADKQPNPVLTRALAGLAVNAAASIPLVLLLGTAGRPLAVLAGVSVQLGLLLHLMRGDERIAVLGERTTWLVLLAQTALTLFTAAGLLVAFSRVLSGGAAAILAALGAGTVTLLAMRAYQRSELRAASAPGSAVG